MSGKAAKTELTTRMHEILCQLSSSRIVGNRIVARAKIILMAFQKDDNRTIGKQLGFSAKTVGIWRRRWRDSFAALLPMQFIDEMTSVQANERRAETKLPKPGQTAKEEFQYTRHGTVCVTGNWHVVRGQMLAPTISETRGNQDFSTHIKQTVATDPTASWVFVVDNLNTHCGEPLVRLVADQLGTDQATLGAPKQEGVLNTMDTRRAFLSDPSHRIRFVYLPKHSSWLNQIEIIFGVINRRVMRRGSFTSKFDLIEKLKRFINYFNETIAQPMNWTYTGRPTHNAPKQRPRTWRELRQDEKPWKKLALVGTNL